MSRELNALHGIASPPTIELPASLEITFLTSDMAEMTIITLTRSITER